MNYRGQRYSRSYRREAPWERKDRIDKRNRRIISGTVIGALALTGVVANELGLGDKIFRTDTDQPNMSQGFGYTQLPELERNTKPIKSAYLGLDTEEINEDIVQDEAPLEETVDIITATQKEDSSATGMYRSNVLGTLTGRWSGFSSIGGEIIRYSPNKPETFIPLYDALTEGGRYVAVVQKELWDENYSTDEIFSGTEFRESVVASSLRNEAFPNEIQERSWESVLQIFGRYYQISDSPDKVFTIEEFLRTKIFNRGFSPDAFYFNYGGYFNNADIAPVSYTQVANDGNTTELHFNTWDQFILSVRSSPGSYSDHDIYEIVSLFKTNLSPSDLEAVELEEGSRLFGLLQLVDGQGNFFYAYKEFAQSDEALNNEAERNFGPILDNLQQIQTADTASESFEAPFEYPPMSKSAITFEVQRDFRFEPQIVESLLRGNSLDHLVYPISGAIRLGQDVGIPAEYQRYANPEGYHTGLDLLPNPNEEDNLIIAPFDMNLLMILGNHGNYGRNERGPIGLGEAVVIGWRPVTFTDEFGREVVADLYQVFGHMELNSDLKAAVDQYRGHVTAPHELVSFPVEAGTVIGIMGSDGYGTEENPVRHLHWESMISINRVGGVDVGSPNSHLDFDSTGIPPGIKVVVGKDGNWYIQTGSIFPQLNEGRGPKYQWPHASGYYIDPITGEEKPRIIFIKLKTNIRNAEKEGIISPSSPLTVSQLETDLAHIGAGSISLADFAKGRAAKPELSRRFINSVLSADQIFPGIYSLALMIRDPNKNFAIKKGKLYINGISLPLSANRALKVQEAIERIRAKGSKQIVRLVINQETGAMLIFQGEEEIDFVMIS